MFELNMQFFVNHSMLKDIEKVGIADPVVLVLTGEAPQARMIAQDLATCPITKAMLVEKTGDGGSMVAVEAANAISLLRKHAGKGGCYVGGLLEEKLPADVSDAFRLVSVMEDLLGLVTFSYGIETWRTTTRYDGEVVLPIEEVLCFQGQNVLDARLPNGSWLTVHGRNRFEMIQALHLAAIAMNRQAGFSRDGVPVRVTEDDLASMLIHLYVELPHVIAEAIIALEKLPGHQQRFLKKVLWGRPELRVLAKKVEQELTGK